MSNLLIIPSNNFRYCISSSRISILFFKKKRIPVSLLKFHVLYYILSLVRFFKIFVMFILKSLSTKSNIYTDLCFYWFITKVTPHRAVQKGNVAKERTWVNWIAIWKKKNSTSTSHHTPKSIPMVSRSKCSKKNSMLLEHNTGQCPYRQWFLKQDSNNTNRKRKLIDSSKKFTFIKIYQWELKSKPQIKKLFFVALINENEHTRRIYKSSRKRQTI